MSPRRWVRRMMTGAVVLAAVSAVLLAAPSADAASNLSMSVQITAQSTAGAGCSPYVTFNATITNSSAAPVTVTSVNSGHYEPLHAGPAAGTVLPPGPTTFTGVSAPYGGPWPGCTYLGGALPPLVLTVNTAAGSATWNESMSDPQVGTGRPTPGTNALNGSFDVADCSQYYFQYGTTAAYGQQTAASGTSCPNDGTATVNVTATVPGLSGSFHYRLVVVQSNGPLLYGQDWPGGGTGLPVGSVGFIGVAALAGCGLFVAQRHRRKGNAPSGGLR